MERLLRLKAVALSNKVLNTLFVKRSGFVGKKLLFWYGSMQKEFGAKTSKPQFRQFQVRAERKRGFPPINSFFYLVHMTMEYQGKVSNKKINNRTFEKMSFKNVGNLICPKSCLTSTSSGTRQKGNID